MKNLSIKTKTESAMKMVIMDAIENGDTNKAELIKYMKSKAFKAAVNIYIEEMSK